MLSAATHVRARPLHVGPRGVQRTLMAEAACFRLCGASTGAGANAGVATIRDSAIATNKLHPEVGDNLCGFIGGTPFPPSPSLPSSLPPAASLLLRCFTPSACEKGPRRSLHGRGSWLVRMCLSYCKAHCWGHTMRTEDAGCHLPARRADQVSGHDKSGGAVEGRCDRVRVANNKYPFA